MKLLGFDTEGVKLVGKFTFTNTTEFPVVVSLWQTGPLYYRVVQPNETWSTGCGSVWFTAKVWLYNGQNNINPGIKYSLLAGNIAGFAALGALGLTATALASQYGVSRRNPDWDVWLRHNGLFETISDQDYGLGAVSIGLCEYSQAGLYAGRHPHLFVSGGPIQKSIKSDRGIEQTLEWHEIRLDKCPYENALMPLIRNSRPADPSNESTPPPMPARRTLPKAHELYTDADEDHHQINLLEHAAFEDSPALPAVSSSEKEDVPALPKRPIQSTDVMYDYKISK